MTFTFDFVDEARGAETFAKWEAEEGREVIVDYDAIIKTARAKDLTRACLRAGRSLQETDAILARL